MDSTADILNRKVIKVKIDNKEYTLTEPSMATLRKFQTMYENIVKEVTSITEVLESKRMQLTAQLKEYDDGKKKLDEKVADELAKALIELQKESIDKSIESNEYALEKELDLYNLIITPNFTKEEYENLTPTQKQFLDKKVLEVTGLIDFFAGKMSLIQQISQLLLPPSQK